MRERKSLQLEPVLGIISAIKYQQKDNLRASIYVDARFAFGVNVATIEHFRLRKGDEIDSIYYEKIQSFDRTIAARRIAQRFLNSRRRTERDVRRKLKEKDIPDDVINDTIEELKTAKLIDDAAFAQAFIHDRLLTKSISRGKLALELQAKGVNRDVANEVLRDLTTEDDDFERAMKAAAKKLPSIERKESDERQRSQKLYTFLASRGFTGTTIRKTLAQLGQEAEEEVYA